MIESIETKTPIEAYYKIQESVMDVIKLTPCPIVWNTQRQMGKTTVLAKLAATYLANGDVWFMCYNPKSEENFIDKTLLYVEEQYKVRNLKSRIELAKNDGNIHRMVSPTKFYKNNLGLDTVYNQPTLVVIDNIEQITCERLDNFVEYLTPESRKNTKIVAATTGIGRTTTDWFATYFERPEIITTAFDSINLWMNDIYGIKE